MLLAFRTSSWFRRCNSLGWERAISGRYSAVNTVVDDWIKLRTLRSWCSTLALGARDCVKLYLINESSAVLYSFIRLDAALTTKKDPQLKSVDLLLRNVERDEDPGTSLTRRLSPVMVRYFSTKIDPNPNPWIAILER